MESHEYEEFVSQMYEALITQELGQVHRSRQYLGRRTGHSHQIDLAIEIRMAGMELLIVIECKHYERRVEVGDVLEFVERVSDISAQKGVIVSKHGFQRGALKVARAHSIALVKTEPVWETILLASGLGALTTWTAVRSIGRQPNGGDLVGHTVVAVNCEVEKELSLSAAWGRIVRYLASADNGDLPTSDSGKRG